MSRRLCPECFKPMEIETIGRSFKRLVAYCSACRLVDDPSPIAAAPDYPRSSEDR